MATTTIPEGRATATRLDVITPTQVVDLADPKLKSIGKRVLRILQLETEKAVANRTDPSAFPLPETNSSLAAPTDSSAEDLFRSWFDRLPPEKKQATTAKVMASINAPPDIRARVYGDLAKVDLRSATLVADQAAALPIAEDLGLTVDYLNRLSALQGQILIPTPLTPASDDGGSDPGPVLSAAGPIKSAGGTVTNKLELRIIKVKCLDETDPEFFGDDEISLGGSTVDQSGLTKKVSAFQVRNDFSDGVQQVYSPAKSFASFDLTAGTTFPKSYFATLVLAETDMGGLGDFLNQLWAKVSTKVLAAIAAAVGGAIGSTVPGLGTIVGAVVGFVVGVLIDYIIGLFSDDIFKPFTVSVTIPSLNHRFTNGSTDSPDFSIFYTGYGGKYQVVFDWRMFS